MDPVRKFVANRLTAQVAGQPHPDAELLSAFAENALLPKEREGVLEHLGACAACREVLFLALPDASDTQKVLAVPKFRPRFAMRWAALAASIVIVGAVLVVRHEHAPTTQVAKKSATPEGYVQQPAIVAMNKVPAAVDAMREAQAPAKTAPAAPKARPEEKHITAKPSVTMNFEQSGQVQVEPTPSADRVAESRIKDLPLQGRDTSLLIKVPTVNAPAQNMVGQAAGDQPAYAYSRVGAFAKQAAMPGSLGGIVVDGSGAVVANAKVTRVGPMGTETLTVGADGKFSFDQLPPGQYSLRAAALGFRATDLKQVAVLAGKPSDVRVKLDVGATSETVEVSAAAVSVEVVRADAARLDDKSVNGAVATTEEAEVIANEKQEKAQLTRKKVANARQAPIGGGVGAGAAAGPGAPVFQWTLSPEGAVQRSLDGGETWQSVSVADQASFRTLSAVGRDIWVGGKSGSLYHSPDSGQRWTRVVLAVNGEKLNADVTRVNFSDLQNGVVSTSNGQVWTTSDGGQTWQRK